LYTELQIQSIYDVRNCPDGDATQLRRPDRASAAAAAAAEGVSVWRNASWTCDTIRYGIFTKAEEMTSF